MARQQDDAAATRSELLIRDAEEALQRERMQMFWHQWGATIIGMALMLVMGTAAGVAWREWRENRDEASTIQLLNVVGDDAVPMTPLAAKSMTDTHAAIAWLTKAGTVDDTASAEGREALAEYYGLAASADDGSAWGQLSRLNLLRLAMDDETQDPAALLKQYESLAGDMKGSALAALAWTDAAVIAGERLKTPGTALQYLARADKLVTGSGAMAVLIADLRHLYEIRAQSAIPDDADNKEKAE